jgi:hypothetical protein
MESLSEVTVGHGPRRDLLSVAILVTFGVSALVGIAGLGLPSFGRSVGVGGFLAVVVVTFPVSAWVSLCTTTEEVVLRPTGFSVRRRLFGTARLVEGREVRWEWLDPVPRGWIALGFVTYRWHRPDGYLAWFQVNVTPTQARAMLAYPTYPKGVIPPLRFGA